MKSKLLLFVFGGIFLNFGSISGSPSPNQPLQTNLPQQLQQVKQTANNLELVTPIQSGTSNLNQIVLAPQNNLQPLIQAALAIAPKIAPQPKPATSNETLQSQSTKLISLPVPPIVNQNIKSQVVSHNQMLNLKPTTTAIVNTNIEQANYGNADDPIQYLDYLSMNDEILKRRTANFVYFNANFNQCRHCNKLFNIWKELAIDIRWWGQIIKLSTINCSDEDNLEVCRRAGVTQFPQVRYYWCMSNSLERDGQRLRILGKSVHAMRHLIMDKVFDSYIEHNKALAQLTQPKAQANNNLGAGGSGGQTSSLSSLMSMPVISQLFSGNNGNGNANSNSGSKLSSLMNLFLGAGGKNDGNIVSTGNGNLPLANLIGSTGINLASNSGSNQIINALMSVNSILPQKITQPLASNWPELEAIEIDDAQQLVNMLPLDITKNVGALLIMETQEFLYTGLEVMLDLNPYANQTYIARVRDEKSQLSRNLTKRDDIQAPAIIYVTPSREIRLIMTAPKYTNDEDLRRAFVRAFERRQIKYPVKRVWSMPSQSSSVISGKTSAGIDSQEDEELLNKVNQVHMNDLTNALRASLMEQIFRHPDLSDDQYNALVKYVYTLINYFPFNSDESLKFFRRLHAWLQNQVSPMDINEYKKQFHDIDEVLHQKEWISCRSMSNTKAIPNKAKKANSLFENPAQFGKVVSNITRFLRGNQQQTSKFKSLLNMFTSGGSTAPVMLSQSQYSPNSGSHGNSNKSSQQQHSGNNTSVSSSSSSSNQQQIDDTKKEADSPIERIIKSLTSGSMGSDSSILKLISTTLTGSSNGDSASSGRSKFAREYPCGIWKLAHVMVVNEYIKDSPRKDVKHIVLHCLYQYMLQFYACPTCGNRVSDVSGEFRLNLDEHLQDQGDSVLLLWKVHNRVNKRLESELRAGSPAKIQFPAESLCPKCRAPRAQTDLVSTPNWHEKQVLNFLVHHYRPQSILSNSSSSLSTSSSSAAAITLLVVSSNLMIDVYLLPISTSFLILSIVNYCSSSINTNNSQKRKYSFSFF